MTNNVDTLKQIHEYLIDAKAYMKSGRILQASRCISKALLLINTTRKRERNAQILKSIGEIV